MRALPASNKLYSVLLLCPRSPAPSDPLLLGPLRPYSVLTPVSVLQSVRNKRGTRGKTRSRLCRQAWYATASLFPYTTLPPDDGPPHTAHSVSERSDAANRRPGIGTNFRRSSVELMLPEPFQGPPNAAHTTRYNKQYIARSSQIFQHHLFAIRPSVHQRSKQFLRPTHRPLHRNDEAIRGLF